VARNRKRAKERRARRPEPVVSARRDRDDGAPAPIAHAAPDVEIAEAQLAVGRPEPELDAEAGGPLEDEDAAQNGELPADAEALEFGGGRGGGRALSGGGRAPEPAAAGPAAIAEPRVNLAARLIAFLQGCWAELQRVQWPDRRQVMQATGVVIGFVIIAGVFLGVADYLSQQVVKLILK
jgi:preprotein translocase subunit SecE